MKLRRIAWILILIVDDQRSCLAADVIFATPALYLGLVYFRE